MRIVWLSHSPHVGGAELALVEGVSALAGRGHDLHVVLPRDGPLRALLETAATTIHYCDHDPWLTSTRNLVRGGWWLAYDLAIAAPRIREVVRRVQADVVISNTIMSVAGALACRGRTPHVWFLHEFGSEDHEYKFLLGRQRTMRSMSQLASVFVVNSTTLHDHFARWLPRDRIYVAHYAVDMKTVPSSSSTRRMDGPFRLVLVGRRAPSKGQHEAIDSLQLAVAAGLDARLELVGAPDATYDAALQRQVARHGLGSRVRFVGFSRDVQGHIDRSDAALMCSRSEAFGRVTVEAMKLAKPVIGTAAAANLELIKHGWNGFLYQRGDVGELAGYIQTLGADLALAREMGLNGQRWADEQFNPERYGGTLEQALSEAVRTGVRR